MVIHFFLPAEWSMIYEESWIGCPPSCSPCVSRETVIYARNEAAPDRQNYQQLGL